MVLPSTKLLSRMSNGQALKLSELEREYEEALDDNCRIVAEYFKEVLVNNDKDSSISPPLLILKRSREEGIMENGQEEMEETKVSLFKNGRYNVMLCLLLFYF